MKKAERYSFLIEYFSNNMPQAETELTYDNPFQLLVAVILSAQCTDKRVNSITPNIFKQFPDAKTMSEATFEDIFSIIRSISYPNNKARHLIAMSKLIINDFGGEVPMSVEKLVLLPGVGRKTANVITSVIDNQPNMAVDTHVFRVSTRIGLITNAKTPLAVEKQLVKNLPKELIHKAHHWLILHGRYTCTARNPKCVECGIINVCKFSKNLKNC
jgi:endonuclease-3